MPDWNFEERDPRYVEHELTQRDQFNNDEVTLAEAIVREVIQNSADAALDATPVKVRFSLHEISPADAHQFRQQFLTLRPHLSPWSLTIEVSDCQVSSLSLPLLNPLLSLGMPLSTSRTMTCDWDLNGRAEAI